MFYDGDCGFCKRSAHWFQRRIRTVEVVVCPFQDAPSPPMTDEIRKRCARAVHVLTPDGRWLRAGRASLYLFRLAGWGWFASGLMLPPFVWVMEFFYWMVANNRNFFARFMFRS